MKFLYLLIFAMLIGCEAKEESRNIPPEPDCNCPAQPTFYMIQLEYKDHKEKIRSFPYKVEWNRGSWNSVPDTMYATKGVSIDGSFSWYYSLEEPRREENGLITIKQVDGPVKKIDFKEIEVTLHPCQASNKLDELSKKRILEAAVYVDHGKNECPYHKDGGWHDEHGW